MKLAKIFQNGMTLQRNKPVKIWGESSKTQTIVVKLNSQVLGTYEIKQGEFQIQLPELKTAENITLEIGEVMLANVDIGEIWIAGGQSNMEFRLEYDAEGDSVISTVNDEHFRCYHVAQYAFNGEKEDGFKDDSEWEEWMTFTSEKASCFSAVGAYFAQELRQSGVPVAIIGCNWGGTSAATWMDKNLLLEDEELKTYVEDFEALVAKLDLKKYYLVNRIARKSMNGPQYKKMMDTMLKNTLTPEMWSKMMSEMSANSAEPEIQNLPDGLVPEDMAMENLLAIGPNDQNRPGALYEMMVSQIAGFTARGVLWYQGETDDKKAGMYAKLFAKMIACWRKDWQDELPFLFVQLAPFGIWRSSNGELFPALRKQQELVSKTIKDTYMISASDVGNAYDIHPKHKKPIGHRLALCARNVIYGEDILWEAPEALKIDKEDDAIDIKFLNGEGLYHKGESINAIVILANGHKMKNYTSHIKADMLQIKAKELKYAKNIKVEFAETGYYEVNLYNKADIPAKPFSLEWQLI